jgi:hypothetical protein
MWRRVWSSNNAVDDMMLVSVLEVPQLGLQSLASKGWTTRDVEPLAASATAVLGGYI